MLYEVLGCGSGSMGEAIVWRLLQEDGSVVFVSDQNPEREKETIEKLKKMPMARRAQILGTASGKGLDVVRQKKELPKIFENIDMVISALPANLNPLIAEATVEANESRPWHHKGKTNYCDLGGVLDVTKKIIFGDLARRAEKCGISLVPDCGLEPGLGNILAMDALENFDLKDPLDSLIIYVGGLPEGQFWPGYKKLFNLAGLEEIYYSHSLVLHKGKPRKIFPRSHYELIPTSDFDLFFGEKEGAVKFEAAVTAGLGALPYYLEKHVLKLQEKTLRWPGHYAEVKNIIKNVKKENFVEEFEKTLIQYPPAQKDFCVLRVVATGKAKTTGKRTKIEYFMNVESDGNWTSMQKSTGFTTAIIAKLIAEGRASTGDYPPEIALPTKLVLDALTKDFALYSRKTPPC